MGSHHAEPAAGAAELLTAFLVFLEYEWAAVGDKDPNTERRNLEETNIQGAEET